MLQVLPPTDTLIWSDLLAWRVISCSNVGNVVSQTIKMLKVGWGFWHSTSNVNKSTWRFVYFRFLALSRSFIETTIKTNRIGQDNRDFGALVGKCIHNNTRGRSRKGRIWSCFVLEECTLREVSCTQVIPFHCVFMWNGALFWGRCQKFRVGPNYNGYMTGRLLRWGLGVVPTIIYHCNTVHEH